MPIRIIFSLLSLFIIDNYSFGNMWSWLLFVKWSTLMRLVYLNALLTFIVNDNYFINPNVHNTFSVCIIFWINEWGFFRYTLAKFKYQLLRKSSPPAFKCWSLTMQSICKRLKKGLALKGGVGREKKIIYLPHTIELY